MTKAIPLAPLAFAMLCLAFVLPLRPGAHTAAAAVADVNGTWAFTFAVEDGSERHFNATFKQDGQTVTGKWDAKADVQGTFTDDTLDLTFPYNSDEVGPGTLKLKGKLETDTLTGNWEFQSYTGTFKATRGAAEK